MGYIEDNQIEKELKGQIPEAPIDDTENKQQEDSQKPQQQESMIGKKINVGANMQRIDKDEVNNISYQESITTKTKLDIPSGSSLNEFYTSNNTKINYYQIF